MVPDAFIAVQKITAAIRCRLHRWHPPADLRIADGGKTRAQFYRWVLSGQLDMHGIYLFVNDAQGLLA